MSAPPDDQVSTGRSGEELVEHVDADGDAIEIVTRARMRAQNLRHRSVAIIVTSTDGRLLVHRRADDKDLLPGWWDIAAGGVLSVGESEDSAAARELAEELGITDAVIEFVAIGRYDDDHVREVCHVYRTVHDGPYRFDDGEVTEARLVTPSELMELMAAERFMPGSLAMVLPHVPGFGDPATSGDSTGGRIARIAYDASVQRVEFTVEPFVEGNPGPHVTAPVEAVRALGIDVEFGPFGSECVTPTEQAPDAVAAIVRSAIANGATHVNIDVTSIDDPGKSVQ